MSTGRDERQHHVVARREVLDARADFGDDAGALVTAEDREAAHRDSAGDQMVVGVAHARRFHLDFDFVFLRVADLDFLDRPGLIELPDQRAFGLHREPAFVVERRLRTAQLHASNRLVECRSEGDPGHQRRRMWFTRSVPAPGPAGSSQAIFRRPRCAGCGSASRCSGRRTRSGSRTSSRRGRSRRSRAAIRSAGHR